MTFLYAFLKLIEVLGIVGVCIAVCFILWFARRCERGK